MAVSEWDKQYLSEDEQKKIADVTAAAQAGTMTWADAHSQAEAIRNQHQYSGGAKGNQYNDLTGGIGGTTVVSQPAANPSTPASLANAYAGTNYHQDAINAAQAGDWDAVNRALGARDAKTLATGQNYGRTSQDIYNELWAQYGGNSAVETGDVSKYLKDMYANQTAAELAALKATYEKNVADVEANVPKINEMYEAARNETAAQSEIDKRNFAEYAAARSLNTGTSGQAELARQVALTGNLAGITGQEKNALAENELQKQQLTIAYRNAIDEATAQGNAALAQSLYNEYVRQIEMNTQQSQLDREYAYNIAMGSLQAGIVPDAATLSAAGISAADANNLAGYYKVLGTQKSSGSSSGSYSNNSGGGKSWDDVVSWVNTYGEDAAEDYIGEHYKALGYSSKSAALSGWNNYLRENPLQPVEEESEAAELNWSSVNNLGIGPVSATYLAEIAAAGGIVEDGKGNVSWAAGWNAQNYKTKMATKNPIYGFGKLT